MRQRREELRPGEHVISEFRAHWRYAFLPTVLLALSALCAAAAARFSVPVLWVGSAAAMAGGIIAAVDRFTQGVVVTTTRIIDRGGIVGGRSMGAIPIGDIVSARAEPRTVLDWVLHAPPVEIETRTELMWFSVEHPNDLVGDIEAMILVGRSRQTAA